MIEFRTLRQDELEQWFDHCMYVFNNGEFSGGYREYFMNHWYNDPWRDLDSILVAVDNGKIVSTVRVFHREIFMQGEKVTMGGIGEVSTKPEYRGRGLSSKLLRNAIKLMEYKGINVSMLGASIFDYYRKFGWEQCIMYSAVVVIKDQPAANFKIRPVNPETDLEAIKSIYRDYSSRFNGPVVRSNDSYWNMWVKTECKSFYVAEAEQGNIIAYICVDEGNDYINIKEFGAAKGFEGIFDSLAAHMADAMGKTGCEARYRSTVKSGLKVKRFDEEPYIMLRLITPFKLKELEIETTSQLIDVMSGNNSQKGNGDFLFWGTDGF